MSKLKVLSGEDVIKIFKHFGFIVVGQKGSHVKLKRVREGGISQTLTVPKYQELDRGTPKAIHTQALRYISEHDLRWYFYLE